MAEKKKAVSIPLEDWQQKMVKDATGDDHESYEIQEEDPILVRYAIGVPSNTQTQRMYLTNWQIRLIKKATGQNCDYIELDEKHKPSFRYAAPSPDLSK